VQFVISAYAATAKIADAEGKRLNDRGQPCVRIRRHHRSLAFLRWKAPALGFVVQVLGFGVVALTVAGTLSISLAFGLAIAGVGFGIVMPSVIKAVIGGIGERHAGLASGVVITTFQIGAALGVATIGGAFFSVLGAGQELASYAHAFSIALGCNVALLAIASLLSLWLPGK
jgi:hypothetical protein